jgi:hypothetical protein
MSEKFKLDECLTHIEKITSLISGNEYEIFFAQHLIPLKVEIERQLSLIKD